MTLPKDSWQSNRALAESITLIIPALNEANQIGRTLEALRSLDLETILVDGGSRDATRRIARDHGVQVVKSRPGRAVQMNRGARLARGSILLFAHADTRLPQGFIPLIRNALRDPKVAAGAFRLEIDAPGLNPRLIEAFANWRAQLLQMPYGDQGLFLRADTFHRVGGYPEIPIMEDFELVRRLRQIGCIRVLKAGARTSARRWRALGSWRTTMLNWIMVLGYGLGVSPMRLAQWYRRDVIADPSRKSNSGPEKPTPFRQISASRRASGSEDS